MLDHCFFVFSEVPLRDKTREMSNHPSLKIEDESSTSVVKEENESFVIEEESSSTAAVTVQTVPGHVCGDIQIREDKVSRKKIFPFCDTFTVPSALTAWDENF